MDLYKEIVIEMLKKGELVGVAPNDTVTLNDLVEMKCYRVLQLIRQILDHESLDDRECFMKIEEIVCLYEALGSNGGSRHDFG